jgi:hypothetical protein
LFAGMAGQKPRRPQFVWIAEVLRLPACQTDQPSLGLECDRGFPSRDEDDRPARLSGLRPRPARRNAGPSDDAVQACVRPQISQQYPRPLHPACRFGSRLRYRPQLRRIPERQLDRPPPRCHGIQPLVPKLLVHIWGLESPMNPSLVTTFMESIV